MAIAVLAGAALVAGCAAPNPGAEPGPQIESFDVDGWHQAGALREEDGKLRHCFVTAKYKSGIEFALYRDRFGYSIALQKLEWVLDYGEVYSVYLSVDDLWKGRVESRSVETNVIEVNFGFDGEVLKALRRGSLLTVEAEAETFAFELEEEGATLDRLERCYRENRPQTATAYRNPFATEQNPFKARPKSAGRVKPLGLKKILERATGVDFRVDQASEFTPEVELVYFLEDALYGQFWQRSGRAHSVDGVLAITLADMQTGCSGRAVSGQSPARDGDIGRVRQGFVACEMDDLFADVLVIETDPVISVFVTSSSMDDAELAQEAGNAVGRFFVP